MSVSKMYHASVRMPMTDRSSDIQLEDVAPTWVIKDLLVSAPSKEMLIDLLIKIEMQVAKSIRDAKEMPDADRTT